MQEVRGNLRALRYLLKLLGEDWGFILTDVTKGSQGNDERLAFLFDTGRVKPSGLAEPVDGGYLLRGEWAMGSGSAHADWLVCTALVCKDWQPVQTPAGPDIVMTTEPEHQSGFGFLRRSAIDQHINTRMRWDDLIQVIKKYPDLLGIGLSESTAIIVKGDQFEVMGAWKVAIHDNTRQYQPWEKPYYVLSAGDVYNMKTRKIQKLGNGTEGRPPTPPRSEESQPKKSPPLNKSL